VLVVIAIAEEITVSVDDDGGRSSTMPRSAATGIQPGPGDVVLRMIAAERGQHDVDVEQGHRQHNLSRGRSSSRNFCITPA